MAQNRTDKTDAGKTDADKTDPIDEPREFARRGPYFLSTDPALLDVSLIHAFLSEQSYWAPGITREVVERSLKNSLCFGLFHE